MANRSKSSPSDAESKYQNTPMTFSLHADASRPLTTALTAVVLHAITCGRIRHMSSLALANPDPMHALRHALLSRRRLSNYHTPDIMTNLICSSMDHWLSRRPVLPPVWHGPPDLIQRQLRRAFHAQSRIGWDQFFRGRIAKAWRVPIAHYYKERQPGSSFTPDQWMRTVISELWHFSITIWKHRNAEYHGTDGAISLEHRRKETAAAAQHVYQSTLGSVSPSDSTVLHHHHIAMIIQWNQEHLDAYLQSADIILAERDEAAG